ncbi:MAG: DUF1801 domain-containing protein [Spirochaetes bacterium]|nr:DUF1801 domain-containing protein [Spirochaetota bacterium]
MANTLKKHVPESKADTAIRAYSGRQSGDVSAVCEALRTIIMKSMPKDTGRIYYSMPAWFIDGNPVVAYRAASKHVLVLFWSGQSFKTPGLTPAGKFKAAEIRYKNVEAIDNRLLRAWLRESKKVMWNYRDIRANNGRMQLLAIKPLRHSRKK